MEEYWDLFREEDGTFERVIRRGQKVPRNHYHKTVEVAVTDGTGHLLVTRRALTKRTGPGKYEFPAGSVQAGETPQEAAGRELFEETGLRSEQFTLLSEGYIPGMRRYLFVTVMPDLLSRELVLQPEETIGYAFVTYRRWRKMLIDGSYDASRLEMYTGDLLRELAQRTGQVPESNQARPPSAGRLVAVAQVPGQPPIIRKP